MIWRRYFSIDCRFLSARHCPFRMASDFFLCGFHSILKIFNNLSRKIAENLRITWLWQALSGTHDIRYSHCETFRCTGDRQRSVKFFLRQIATFADFFCFKQLTIYKILQKFYRKNTEKSPEFCWVTSVFTWIDFINFKSIRSNLQTYWHHGVSVRRRTFKLSKSLKAISQLQKSQQGERTCPQTGSSIFFSSSAATSAATSPATMNLDLAGGTH